MILGGKIMKKTLVVLCAVLFAFNAQAFDLAGSLHKVANTADTAAQKIEAQKAADAQAKADSGAAVEQAKADAKAAVEAKKAEINDAVEAKKAEIAAKAEADKAATDAKTAEQKKAIEDTQNSLNNLKKAFSK